MKIGSVAGLAAVALSAPSTVQELTGYSFSTYLTDFNKEYGTAELAQREALFELAKKQVIEHNSNPAHSWKMGINKFSDMTAREFKAFKGKAGGQVGPMSEPPASFFKNLKNVSDLPASVDWRDHGVVTPTKNQGGCGSCWAFSATEVLESHVAVQTGKLLVLSPQELVSCAPNPDECGGTGGCSGATQWVGFNYTEHAGGLSLESSYPYQGITGTCSKSKIKPAAGNKGYVRLPVNDYTSLMNAVATLGPIAISVDASWGSYAGGVFNGVCGSTIDHAVVLVGYGTQSGLDYYLVRNSWGSSWGEDGYIKIHRKDSDSTNCATDTNPASGTACKPYPKTMEVCGLCGILSDSSYPSEVFTV